MISAGGVRETRAGQPRLIPTARDPRGRHARLDPRSDRRERRQRRPSDDRPVFFGEPRGGAVGADALPRDGGKPHPLLREAGGPLGLPARLPRRPPRFRGGVGLVLTAFPLTILAVAPFAGALSDRIGTVALAAGGSSVCALACLLFAASAT